MDEDGLSVVGTDELEAVVIVVEDDVNVGGSSSDVVGEESAEVESVAVSVERIEPEVDEEDIYAQ